MKQPLLFSSNNKRVIIEVNRSHLGLHVKENPNLLDLVKEVVELSGFDGDKVALEVDLNRIVGTTSLVKTNPDDEIIYAKRKDREGYSRFVRNRHVTDTSLVSVILLKENDCYYVWSAWCGALVPTTPGTDNEMSDSRDFWSDHALIYNPSIVQIETETTICPW